MKKVLLTGDLHITKGIRTTIVLDYLDYLEEFYLKHKMEYLIFLGDIFDKSSSIKNETFIPLFLKLLEMKEKGINMIFILGNHDIFSVENDSIVETFAPLGRVIKEKEIININGIDSIFLPYTKKIEEIEELDGNMPLFTHLSIADFSFDNAYHATEKNAFPKKTFEKFDYVFTGHFHRHQSYENIMYVGSPYQLNRGEMGQNKGFVILDIEDLSWEFIEYNNAPKYIEIGIEEIREIEKLDLSNKMAVINVDKKIEDFAKLRYILLEKGVIDIIPIFESIENDETVIEDVKLSNNLEDIAIEYIEKNEDSEEIKKAFLKVLEEVV